MEGHQIERRRLLKRAGVAAGGAVVTGLAVSSPAHADGGRARVTGSWLLIRQDDEPGDTTPVTFVFSLADGGVALTKDISPAGPPGAGAWRGNGGRVKATLWFGFPGEDGPGSPGVTLRVDITGEARREQLTGTYTLAVFIPDGTQVDQGTGTFSGTKIEA